MRWRVIDGVAGKTATCSLGLECTRQARSEMVISAKYFAESPRKRNKDRKKQRKKEKETFFFFCFGRPSVRPSVTRPLVNPCCRMFCTIL